jgi:hypothetical protein
MVDYLQRTIAVPTILFAAILAVCPITSSHGSDGISGDLQRCAVIDAATERLACYDALAGHPVPAPQPVEPTIPAPPVAMPSPSASSVPVARPSPSVSQAPVAEPSPSPVATKPLDDLGSEMLPGAARKEKKELLVRARVTRCEKDARKKYYFVFENGQVWKQVSDKRLSYKQCDFEVTITKDFFGYKMQPDGEDRRVSIARVK